MYGPNHPERLKLIKLICDWNANRLDLFEISEPNEYLEFYGVMRFFYQGDDMKFHTKCLRVSSTATTYDLIEALVIKFHPDLKMLTNDRYALYEVHNLQERKMKDKEFPLYVQLNWGFDDKEGKFILKNESRRRRSTDLPPHTMMYNYGMNKSMSSNGLGNGYDNQTIRSQSTSVYGSGTNFFSKRGLSSKKSKRRGKGSILDEEEAKRIAAELSGKPPESSFTRTISNPDEVMKRRRQKQLEDRLEHFSGDNETGGTLKIYGDSINPDIPYKTLLLSVNDTAEKVLAETLDKYGLVHEDHRFYVLVQNNFPKSDRNRGEMVEEIILHDQDCPLGILVHCPPKRGTATFAVRRRTPIDKLPSKPRVPPFSIPSKATPKSPRPPSVTRDLSPEVTPEESFSSLLFSKDLFEYPRLVKLSIDSDRNLCDEDEIYTLKSLINNELKTAAPTEGSKFIKIGSHSTAVGNLPNILLLQSEYPDIRPTHCHIGAKLDSQNNQIRLTLTPTLDSNSRIPKPCLVYINQQKIEKSTKLRDEDIIQIGESVLFRFEDPDVEQQKVKNISANVILDHMRSEGSIESIQINYLTADLPITVKHSYNESEALIERILELSRAYANKCCKDLFGCNTDPRFHNMDELFRLAPAYTFYLTLRSGLGNDKHVMKLINIIAENIEYIIHDDKNSIEKEVFWLSNTSELMHLLKCDNDLRHLTGAAEDILASAIEQAFSIIQSQFTQDLLILLPAFIDPSDLDKQDDIRDDSEPCMDRAIALTSYENIDNPIQHLLQTLSLAHILFSNCQVNVALTIQMFSQLFHLLNTWLFNAVLNDPSNPGSEDTEPISISPEWGTRLDRRLNRIRNWSEKNGLEMAANCHLQKMSQVVDLMKVDKRDLNEFGEKCLELSNINGNQLQYLLQNCTDCDLPDAWIEVVVNTAIQWYDQAYNDGIPQSKKKLPFYEDLDLRLPLLLPADGYCCDRGIVSCPTDLKSMLTSLSDLLSYKLNPPTQNEIADPRWKAYLGPYENTPSVSRSNTLIEQSPVPPIKLDTLHKLPRHILPEDRNSVTLSSPDSHININVAPKVYKIPDRPKELPVEIRTEDYTDASSDSEVFKSDLKYRYQLKLTKINRSLGLSIIAARKNPSDIYRIYIKDLIPGGAGIQSGKIELGDQLVSVDGKMMENFNQEEAVEFMKKTKPTVTLVMERGAAQRHGVLDSIVKIKNQKVANAQVIQKKLPIPPVEAQKNLKSKPIVHNSKGSAKLGSSHRPASRDKSSPVKPQISTENKKRTEYKLPPVPVQVKGPPRPPRGPQKGHQKKKIEDVDLSEQEFHTLPVRKKPAIRPDESAIYGSVAKNKSSRQTDDSLSSFPSENVKLRQSSSQPNLLRPLPKKQFDSPESSYSSSSGSLSTSEEDSVENKPPLKTEKNTNKKLPNHFTKVPPPPKYNVAPPRPPAKSFSDNNLQSSGKSLPRHDVKASVNPGTKKAKEPLISRPHITPSSEPIMKINSESSLQNLSLKNPVKLPSKRRDSSQSSSSESESETLSSASESVSSDHSPKPQKKINSEPIISINSNSSIKSVPTPKVNAKINVEKPAKEEIPKYDKQPQPIPFSKREDTAPYKPKTDIKASIPKSNRESPTPLISTSASINPQYQPPKALEENNWNTWRTPTAEEIEMRRKSLRDKFRQETKQRVSTPSPTESRSESLAPSEVTDNKPNPVRTSQYGRPVFNDTKKLNTSVDLNSPSGHKGIIVPASPVIKSQTQGFYEKNDDKEQVPGEELTFKEKMQLFAQKNGENQVVNRNKFSSRQRKIDSGDYS